MPQMKELKMHNIGLESKVEELTKKILELSKVKDVGLVTYDVA